MVELLTGVTQWRLLIVGLLMAGLALGSVPDLGPGPRADLATAGALALAVVSTAFTDVAPNTLT